MLSVTQYKLWNISLRSSLYISLASLPLLASHSRGRSMVPCGVFLHRCAPLPRVGSVLPSGLPCLSCFCLPSASSSCLSLTSGSWQSQKRQVGSQTDDPKREAKLLVAQRMYVYTRCCKLSKLKCCCQELISNAWRSAS